MFRVLSILTASVVAGCALDPPIVITKNVTKIVTVKEPGRTCKPMTATICVVN